MKKDGPHAPKWTCFRIYPDYPLWRGEAVLRHYQELGVERAVLAVPSEARDKVLPVLDQYAALIPKFA